MSMAPIIETERLRLRGHGLADFEALAALWAEPAVTRFIGGKPATREESWARLHRYAGHWALMGYGFWVIEDKASGRFAGEAGFADFKREIAIAFDAPEQGWILATWAHGKGYAREACTAMLDWAEAHFKRRDFICMIAPENAPSLHLAAHLGYSEIARTTYKGAPSIILRR